MFSFHCWSPWEGEGLLWTSLSVSVQQSPLRETGSLEVSEECCPAVREDEADLVINGSDGDIWVRQLVRLGPASHVG